MTFKYYIKDVYGEPLKYPLDNESAAILCNVGGGKTATTRDINRMEFFGVNSEEVLRPKI